MINEKLGVPKGINEESIKIYNSILKDIERFNRDEEIDEDLFEGNRISMTIGVYDITILDLEVKYPVMLNLFYNKGKQSPIYFSAGQSARFSVKDDLRAHSDVKDGSLSINVAVFSGNKQSEVVDVIKNNLKQRHIAHEIMHIYDEFKTKSRSLKQRGEYGAFNIQSFPMILKEILYLLYYTTTIENSVRPVEMYQDMIWNNVKKSQFKSYIEESEIINTLKKAENFTLEGYKKILDSSNEIEEFLKDAKSKGYKSIGKNSDDALNILRINIMNKTLKDVDNFIKGYIMSSYFDGEVDVDKANQKFNSIVKSYEKFKDNDEYFEFLIKSLNFAGKKMKKKLYKLYDMIEEKKVIVDWNTYCEITGSEIVHSIDFNSFKKK
jgi:hypothetical protein